jgi:hypothetical protein
VILGVFVALWVTFNNKIFSQVTENTYSNDITNWHLGRLSSAKVTHNATNTVRLVTISIYLLIQ